MTLPRSGIVPYLFYEDAAAMMDWYARVFGFVELSRWLDPEGNVRNGEMSVGETELWLDGGGTAYWEQHGRGPAPWIGVWVEDLDATSARIRSEGIELGEPVERNFGVRMSDQVVDPAGYQWSFMERVSLPDPNQTG